MSKAPDRSHLTDAIHLMDLVHLADEEVSAVPSENLIRWIRSRKENRIMIETDGELLETR
jgi:hypothetical protein